MIPGSLLDWTGYSTRVRAEGRWRRRKFQRWTAKRKVELLLQLIRGSGDWFHKLGNILDKLPKRLQPRVKAALHEVMYAENREQAREAISRFGTEYGPKYRKAVTTLEKDADVLLAFFDF